MAAAAAHRPPGGWARWDSAAGLPHVPRGLPAPAPPEEAPQTTLSNLRLAVAAEHVYESVDALACALQAQLLSFAPWQRRDPSFKPIISGFIWTTAGPRRVTLMLDTGATHCFICAQLARALNLPVSSDPGPTAVTLATPDATRSVSPPVVVHLSLGDAEPLREVIAMSPLDLGPELDIILGWDWLSSHDLRFLYPQGCVSGGGPQGPLSVPLRPTVPAASQASVLIGHGEFRRMLRRVVPAGVPPPDPAPAEAARLAALPPSRHGGMSKPLDPLGTAELAEADRQRQLRRTQRRSGRPSSLGLLMEPKSLTTARGSTARRSGSPMSLWPWRVRTTPPSPRSRKSLRTSSGGLPTASRRTEASSWSWRPAIGPCRGPDP